MRKLRSAFRGVVLADRSRASTRMHVRKRKASYFNCNFMASLMFAVLVRPVANDALHIVHAFSIWDEQVYAPRRKPATPLRTPEVFARVMILRDRQVHDRLLGAVG